MVSLSGSGVGVVSTVSLPSPNLTSYRKWLQDFRECLPDRVAGKLHWQECLVPVAKGIGPELLAWLKHPLQGPPVPI